MNLRKYADTVNARTRHHLKFHYICRNNRCRDVEKSSRTWRIKIYLNVSPFHFDVEPIIGGESDREQSHGYDRGDGRQTEGDSWTGHIVGEENAETLRRIAHEHWKDTFFRERYAINLGAGHIVGNSTGKSTQGTTRAVLGPENTYKQSRTAAVVKRLCSKVVLRFFVLVVLSGLRWHSRGNRRLRTGFSVLGTCARCDRTVSVYSVNSKCPVR